MKKTKKILAIIIAIIFFFVILCVFREPIMELLDNAFGTIGCICHEAVPG